MQSDDELMNLALDEARKAPAHGDVPVGALVVMEEGIISARHNERERLGDPTAHAGILALSDAARELGHWHLDSATVVVTLEPCVMCGGAIVGSRVNRCVFGAFDPKGGAFGSLYNLACDPRLSHQVELASGVLADQSAAVLREFFTKLR